MGNRREFEVKDFSEANTAVGNSTLVDIGSPILFEGNFPDCYFEVQNLHATIALQAFAVLVQIHGDSTVWHTLMARTADFQDSTIEIHPWGSGDGDIPTLAALATMAARFKFGAINKIKFQARAASSTVSIVVRGLAWRNA